MEYTSKYHKPVQCCQDIAKMSVLPKLVTEPSDSMQSQSRSQQNVPACK